MQPIQSASRRNLVIVAVILASLLGWPWLHRAFGSLAGANDPTKQVAAVLVGSWQSVDDPKFVREFSAEGKCTEKYDGRMVVREEYRVYDAATVPKELVPAPVAGTTYLAIGGVGPDTLVFSLVKVTATELEMTYLARGNTLRFTRR